MAIFLAMAQQKSCGHPSLTVPCTLLKA